MPQNFRQSEILQLARDRGKVVVEELAAHFGVTLQTIRRDLSELADAGKLNRVYGGAILSSGVENIGYEERRKLNPDEKDRIGRLCASEIPDDASLFLNIGTTTEAVARALLSHRNLMVVTNNLNVANIMAQNPTAEVIVAGGVLRRADAGLVGDMTLEIVRHFKVDFAVIGASALDEDGDLLDFDFREVRVSQAILAQARRRFLVADRSKFNRTAPVRIASLAEIDVFFTDVAPPPPVVKRCAEWETEIRHLAQE
ncbi:DeoR/GlpR family DNA-binding transcription regulator [Plastorhodobacter daqingensis]|uniref:DeoR/GlpR family DNA-binding transcription regulator n=1 Tax=Plastorhodobacter daqingensis TaxID=1387281 RepID=A0ABW2URA0_9RHOB